MVALVERLQGGVEHAVDPVLGQHLAVLGLDVDVGGAPVDGAQDQRVDQPHDRALVGPAASQIHRPRSRRRPRAGGAAARWPARAGARRRGGASRPRLTRSAGATTASIGRPRWNSSSSTLEQVLEAAEGQHQPRAFDAARARSRSAPAARGAPRPRARDRRGRASSGSYGRPSARVRSAMSGIVALGCSVRLRADTRGPSRPAVRDYPEEGQRGCATIRGP